MPSRISSIIDANAFNPAESDEVSPAERSLIERRIASLGSSYRLFYHHPVYLVRSEGNYLYGPAGERYLDAYNNVASIGHAHPAVVAAVHAQMSQLSTHSRYLQRGVVDYAERLLATFPEELDQVMFTNSGSEANDLALRVAQSATGGTGVVVTSEAYHGTSAAVNAISPSASPDAMGPHVRAVAAPDTYRFNPVEGFGPWMAAQVTAAFAELREAGYTPSAFIVDSIFSSDGVFTDPTVLAPAVAAARQAGALFIADEVQPGFARTGSHMWGFQRHEVVPDLVTLGKPMGNGIPVAAMVARHALLDGFGQHVPYFNTFGGSSVPIAAANAVLDVIEREGLQDNAAVLGERLLTNLRESIGDHQLIGDIRGAGLFLGVEIVSDRASQEPYPFGALSIVNRLRDAGVLISVAGPHSNILKIRPLLSYTATEVDLLVDRLTAVVSSTVVESVAP